jgi:hypothetical protein
MKNNGLPFSDAGSSGFKINEFIWLIMKDLTIAAFFAISMLLARILLKINKLLVEAAGVEPDIGTENTQVTDTENA